jgi:nickel transport protein
MSPPWIRKMTSLAAPSLRILVAALLLTLVPNAWAHGVWIAQRTGEPALVMGKGAEDVRYTPGTVTRFEGFNLAGDRVKLVTRSTMEQLRFKWEPELAVVVSELRPGPMTRRADGVWRRGARGPKEDGVGFETFRYGIHVFADGQAPRLPQRARLMIEPIGSILKVKVGDEVAVRVLFDGKPLADAKVSPDYITAASESARADKDGKVMVRVRNDGLNALVARHEVDADGRTQGIDRIAFSATLSFILPVEQDGKRHDLFRRAAEER